MRLACALTNAQKGNLVDFLSPPSESDPESVANDVLHSLMPEVLESVKEANQQAHSLILMLAILEPTPIPFDLIRAHLNMAASECCALKTSTTFDD